MRSHFSCLYSSSIAPILHNVIPSYLKRSTFDLFQQTSSFRDIRPCRNSTTRRQAQQVRPQRDQRSNQLSINILRAELSGRQRNPVRKSRRGVQKRDDNVEDLEGGFDIVEERRWGYTQMWDEICGGRAFATCAGDSGGEGDRDGYGYGKVGDGGGGEVG